MQSSIVANEPAMSWLDSCAQVEITKEMIETATLRTNGFTPTWRTRSKRDTFHGFLGQACFESFVYEAESQESFGQDYTLNGKSVEVKTVTGNCFPKGFYTFDVYLENWKLKTAQLYVGIHILKDYKTAWIVGWASRERMDEIKMFKKKGDKKSNGNVYDLDLFSFRFDAMWPMTTFWNEREW